MAGFQHRGAVRDPRASGTGRQGTPLWTPANVITVVRIFGTFLWVACAEWAGRPTGYGFSWPAFGLLVFYAALSLTDTLDGYLARSRNEVTDFGKFMDPIADKLVVAAALLVLFQWYLIDIWVVILILAREFLVSSLRMIVASKGVVVAASNLGKWKTGTTMGAILGYLLAVSLPWGIFQDVLLALSWVAMVVAVVLTVWSGVDYFLRCWHYLDS